MDRAFLRTFTALGVPAVAVGLWSAIAMAQVAGPLTAPPPSTARPLRMRMGPDVPRATIQNMPPYPPTAIEQRVEGDVVLHIMIAGDGTVRDVKPVSGQDVLIQSATEAVKHWQYQLLQLNGLPVEMDTMVGLKFSLGPPPKVTVDNFAAQRAMAADTTAFRAPTASTSAPHGEPLTGASGACDFPFVATHYDSSHRQTVIPDLAAAEFSARLDDTYVTIGSAGIDAGPKQIGVVVDASRNIPDDEWEPQVQMAATFIEHARPQDSLFVFLAGVDVAPERVASPSATAARLKRLMSSRPSPSDSSERNYDALFATAQAMQPPRFGDTLILFGRAEDEGSFIGASKLKDIVLKNRVRFIVLSFSIGTLGKSPNWEGMTRSSGYFIGYHDLRSLDQPGQIDLMEDYMRDLYGWIASPYRLRMESADIEKPAELTVYLSDAAERGIRDYQIHYPGTLYPCSATPAP